jgi:hypothetical protein
MGTSWLIYATLGGAGALTLEIFEVIKFIKRVGRPPWVTRSSPIKKVRRREPLYPRWPIFLLASALKVLTGAIFVAVLGGAGQVSAPLTALLLGGSASGILRRLAEGVAVPERTDRDDPVNISLPGLPTHEEAERP